jgi:hypothetical protein
MYCNKTWNFEFMQINFRSAYLEKAYKDKKKQILFEKEKALLPQTQNELQEEKKREERVIAIKRATLKLNNTIDKLKIVNKKKSKTPEDIEELHDLVYVCEIRRKQLDDLYNNTDGDEKEEKKDEKILPSYPCAVNDCRGYLTYDDKKKKMICGMCETAHCKKCRCEEKDEHKCDPNTLETIKLMDKDTKSCPSCSIPIYKIEGCDQMWCTKCHTAFSWKSGKIETGHIHNPHYWKWLQTSGKDLDAVRRMANENRTVFRFENIAGFANNNITDMFGIFTHIRYVELPRFVPENDNKDLRIKYLKKETNDKNFLMTLYRREKKFKFDTEMTQILTMYLDTTQELILDTFNNCENRRDFVRYFYAMCVVRLKELTQYARKEIEKLYHRYDYTMTTSIKSCFDKLYILLQKPPTQSVKKQHPNMMRMLDVGIPRDVDEATRAAIERALWEE